MVIVLFVYGQRSLVNIRPVHPMSGEYSAPF
jgi:hypothetical protein